MTNQEQIIPIGIVGFDYTSKYVYSKLYLWNNDGKNLYKSGQIIKNIEKAIKIKYDARKFINRCINKKVENISLE